MIIYLFICSIGNICQYRLHFYERLKDRFTITQLRTEILTHYEHQLMKQIHVVVLGLDVLGNPFAVIRGVADGVKSFFYEPYEVSMLFILVQ